MIGILFSIQLNEANFIILDDFSCEGNNGIGDFNDDKVLDKGFIKIKNNNFTFSFCSIKSNNNIYSFSDTSDFKLPLYLSKQGYYLYYYLNKKQ